VKNKWVNNIGGFSGVSKNYVGKSLDNYAKVLWHHEKQANSKYKDIMDEKFIFQNKLCVKGFRLKDVFETIKERKSVRVPFDPNRPISKENLEHVLEAARWAPTGHNMQNYEIMVVDDRAVLGRISNMKSCVLEDFLRDNYGHLSFSEEELKHKKTGILSTGFPPDWVDPAKFSQIARSPPIPISNSIRGSPTLLMVLYDPRKKAPALAVDIYGFIGLGCLMENIWLTAQALGIGMQILSLSATVSVEAELKQLLDIPDPLKIAYTIRLGYPTIPAPVKDLRVRRDIGDFTHHNRYSQKGLQ
jgi:nitroreductase